MLSSNLHHIPEELIDDGSFHCCTRIGKSYLLCGRKSSHFPYTLFVGPDWYCMLVTYSLIIVPSILFINNVAVFWGASVIVITVFLMSLTLGFYTMTACSDPGVVYVVKQQHSRHSDEDSNSQGVLLTTQPSENIGAATRGEESSSAWSAGGRGGKRDGYNSTSTTEEHREGEEQACMDLESGAADVTSQEHVEAGLFPSNRSKPASRSAVGQSSSTGTSTSVHTSGVNNRIIVGGASQASRSSGSGTALSLLGTPATPYLPPPPMVECGRCQIDRPRDASHCHFCGLCVKKLDHHCPWTGKCIGEKTLHTFYGFLWSLAALITFVVALVVVALVKGYEIFSFTNSA